MTNHWSSDSDSGKFTRMSPFLLAPPSTWLTANELAFALADGFPVSPGHTLVVTRRLVPTWFDATPAEQAALLALVSEVRQLLDQTLHPKPDGYNVGFNAGAAAGQTVPHVHIHVIPRYHGDVPDPRGGVRAVIPQLANYLAPQNPPAIAASSAPEPAPDPAHVPGPATPSNPAIPTTLTTGHPDSPLWPRLAARLAGAAAVDILSSFVRLSGLDVIEAALFAAIARGARVRILVSDYLGISDPRALQRLLGWIAAAEEAAPETSPAVSPSQPPLAVRLILTEELPGSPASFHPKAWCIRDAEPPDTVPDPTPSQVSPATCVVVGSSNLSRAALLTGVEWNLVTSACAAPAVAHRFSTAFTELWTVARPLDADQIAAYSARVQRLWPDGVAFDDAPGGPEEFVPRPWQSAALASLQQLRRAGCGRALAAVATGMGKTWLAALDVRQIGRQLGRRPRILVIAHRARILAQAEVAISSLLETEFGPAHVSWYLGSQQDFSGNLVIASIQKLCRPAGLALLESTRFDYAILDEVHHAQAPTWRRVLASLQADFILGLTATPERADGVDVANLFDDNLACLASIGDGIEEESLVPFHYVGLADTVEYSSIPWRSGRFDPAELERAVMTSARMERLWSAMQEHPGTRTIFFCCSRRHATFTRNWLRSRGLTAAAVFSGSGSDPVGESLEGLRIGTTTSLCAVDLFNEGLDIPAVDRIVMLRPTESKVLFLQQLGRGLRTSPGKQRLLVLDFVGNHRTFASRLLHLLAIGNSQAGWNGVRELLTGTTPPLPPGCLVDLDLTARDLLQEFLPQGAVAAREAYRQWREDNERRPTALEFFRSGYRPRTAAAAQDGWLNFVRSEGDLTAEEAACVDAWAHWFRMLETTALNRNYKMIVLRVLLDHDELPGGMSLERLSRDCRRYLLAAERTGGSGQEAAAGEQPSVISGQQSQEGDQRTSGGGARAGTTAAVDLRTASDAEWCAWWKKWPIARWLDEQSGNRWFRLEADTFRFRPDIAEAHRPAFARLTSELVDWRLAAWTASHNSHDDRNRDGEGVVFDASVVSTQGSAALSVDRKLARSAPIGVVAVQLPDGRSLQFRFVATGCRACFSERSQKNELPSLLGTWFGVDAGLPGTNQKVRFRNVGGSWFATALETGNSSSVEVTDRKANSNGIHIRKRVSPKDQYVRYAPVYDLVASAGSWGPDISPEVIGWGEVNGIRLQEGMFIARVQGRSMEPRIADGAWCLFRRCPAGSREGRLLLVQIRRNAETDEEARFTVKRYHSVKQSSDEGWIHQWIQLQSLNPEYPAIMLDSSVTEELRVAGEFVQVLG